MCVSQSRQESRVAELPLQTLYLSSGFPWRLLLTAPSLINQYAGLSLTRPSDIAVRSRWLECLHPTLRYFREHCNAHNTLLCVDTNSIHRVWEHSLSWSNFHLSWVTCGPKTMSMGRWGIALPFSTERPAFIHTFFSSTQTCSSGLVLQISKQPNKHIWHYPLPNHMLP